MADKYNPFSDPPISSQMSVESLHPQATKLYEHLLQGQSVNFVQAREMGITHLEKHIADLRRKAKIYSRIIRMHNAKCNEYSLHPLD